MSQYANPKDVEAQATGKVPLDLLEPVADEQIARAMEDGAKKYGVRNYVKSPVAARVYIGAMRRHIAAWLRGEEYAPDSGLHHLAHVGANVHILLAAMEAGTFIDDRDVADTSKSQDEPVQRPCPNPKMGNGGECDCHDQFTGGYEECLADCHQLMAADKSDVSCTNPECGS